MEGPPQLENIDGNGMLVRMPAEGEESLTCLGEPKPGTRLVDGAEQPVSDYVSISVYGQTISLGDQVYLHPEEVGMPCEIGLITRLFEDADGERMVTTRWFWRSVHLEQPSDQPPYHLRELFLSHTSDDSPAAAIERKVTVYHLREADRINKAVFEQPDTFFYKRTYEPQTGRFGLHAPHAGNCLTGADAAPAIATDEPDASRGAAADSTEPPAKRGKRAEQGGRAGGSTPSRAEEDTEAQRALQKLADKVERNRQDVAQRVDEVRSLVKLVKDQVMRIGAAPATAAASGCKAGH